MFNGGTRKRILSCPSVSHSTPTKQSCKPDVSSLPVTSSPSSKHAKDAPKINSLSTSSNNPAYPLRPIHQHNSASNPNTSNNMSNPVPSPVRVSSSFPQELPFSLSRSFMIDYMWHQQQTHHSSINPANANKMNHFQFPPYSALNWIKQQPTSFLFKPNNAPTTIATPQALSFSSSSNDEKPPAFNHFHSAAFKPVINAMRLNDESMSMASNARNHSPVSSSSSNYNHTTTSSTNQSDDEQQSTSCGDKKLMNRKRLQRNDKEEVSADFYGSNHEKEKKVYVTNGIEIEDNNCSINGEDEENEMVDIETTEDDNIQILNLQPYRTSNFGSSIETEDEEEIEVTDGGKFENNNNNLTLYENRFVHERKEKSPIRFLKEIVNRSEREIEENYLLNSTRSSSPHGTLNLKKEVSLHKKILFCYKPVSTS